MDHEPPGGSPVPPAWYVPGCPRSFPAADPAAWGADIAQAEKQFEKILEKDPYRIDDIDIYSNILYVTENKLKLSQLAHDFLSIDKDRPEVCCLVG